MNRSDLQKISRLRLKEAAVLLKAGHYPGAYYLAGYSVECALKACIAKRTKRHDFPDKKLVNDAWVHNLEQLIRHAELWKDLEKDRETNKTLGVNWAVVRDWNVAARYHAHISHVQARDFYSACTARKNGILSWIKKRW